MFVTGENATVSPEEATAPPMDEVLTPEASAPPVEPSPQTPAPMEQVPGIQQQPAMHDNQQQLPQGQEQREGVTMEMRNAALIPVAPEQDPLMIDANYFSNEERRRPREETRWAGEVERLESRRVAEVETLEPRRTSSAVKGRNPIWPTESMQPMSRQELQYYYFNNMLTNQDAMVEEFVKVCWGTKCGLVVWSLDLSESEWVNGSNPSLGT